MTPSLRDEIARRVHAKTNRDQYTDSKWEDMTLFHQSYYAEADAILAILAILTRHTAPLWEAIRAADRLRNATDFMSREEMPVLYESLPGGIDSVWESLEAYDTARRAVGEGR